MSWRSSVNSLLAATIGYELRAARKGPGGKSAPPPAPRSQPDTAVAPSAGPPEPTPLVLPTDFDDAGREVISAVRPWTMTSPDKLYALILATRYLVRHDIPGDIVECGVWRGGSMQAAARTLIQAGSTERDLYLFDTFDGMPPPTDNDRRHDGSSAADLLARNPRTADVWAMASLEDVQSGMAEVGYPDHRVHYVRGLVEETTPGGAPDQIALLRLDTDWYESTKHELEHLYPRLVSGGVLLLDDYGWWQGARQAVDEWLVESGERLLLLRMGSGRIAVKP